MKTENYSLKIRTDLSTIAWLAVILVLMASMAVIFANSGSDGIAKSISNIISNSNFAMSENVLIKSFLVTEEAVVDTEKIALEIHWFINEQRDSHGLNPVAWDSSLAEIAKKHSQDMLNRIYYSHYTPDGKDVADRYADANFECNISIRDGKILKGGENLALISGLEEPTGLGKRIVESWMLSPEHRKNLLYSFYENEGIGTVVSNNELYVTQNFC